MIAHRHQESQPMSNTPTRRWWRKVNRRRLVCPAGHRIPHTFDVGETGFKRCDKHGCDRWSFLFAIRGGGVIVAEVTLDEMTEMEHLSTPTELLDYLGIFPSDGHDG
jgi:hypothetical protein